MGHPRPVGPVDAQSAATTAAVNEALRAAVEDSGMDYVDLASAFAASGDVAALISDDGLHPNAEGIRVIGEALAAAHP
nr:SGNH/GDSL hydrolase family protein [Propioniciclava sp. MC1683]